MRTMTKDEETARRDRSYHLMGTRLLSSGDDRNNNFWRSKNQNWDSHSQATVGQGLFNNYACLSLPALIPSLFKPEASVYTQRGTEVTTLLVLHNKPLFSAFHHYLSYNLGYWSEWQTWCVELLELDLWSRTPSYNYEPSVARSK
jgi:hypothetical protein